MHHLACNYGSIAGSANTDLPAITDGILSIRNSHYTPSNNMNLYAAVALGDLLLRARNYSAHVRRYAPNYLQYVINGAAFGEDTPVVDMMSFPFVLPGAEEIIWQVSNSGAGPTATYLFSWIAPSFTPAPSGEIYGMYGTSTTASVANTWTTISMNWDFQLPQGTYAIVGGAYYGTTALAFRTIVDGQFWRPGGLGNAVEGQRLWRKQRMGGMGLWGTFNTVTLPRIEVLNGGAVSVHTVYLDVIRIG